MPRIQLLVEVDLDPVPGAFHTPAQAKQDIQAILRDRIGHYEPRVGIPIDLSDPDAPDLTPPRGENTGEFDDEFPDEHSHEPQALDNGGVGLHVENDEGRHYYLELKHTDEGVIIDVFDRYGEECLATFARTWEELLALVFANDPLA